MLRVKNHIKKIFLALAILLIANTAYGASVLTISTPHLVTHPDVTGNGQSVGVRPDRIWSQGCSDGNPPTECWILNYEGVETVDPGGSREHAGRKFTVGKLQDLLDLNMDSSMAGDPASRAAYENVIYVLPKQGYSYDSVSVTWSQVPGENDILYRAAYYGSGDSRIERLNVSEVPFPTSWAYVKAIEASPTTRHTIIGWTNTNDPDSGGIPRIAVNRDGENWDDIGWLINVVTKERVEVSSFWKGQCNSFWEWYPELGHGHGAVSPDKTRRIREDSACPDGRVCLYNTDFNDSNCGALMIDDLDEGVSDPVHTTSHYDYVQNDWFIADTAHANQADHNFFPGTLETQKIYQVTIDEENGVFTWYELSSLLSAPRWDVPAPKENINFNSQPHPTLRPDGLQIQYTSTEGHYSWRDCQLASGNPADPCNNWGQDGMYIADLMPANPDPADVNSDTYVNIKDIQETIRAIISPPGNPRADVNGDGSVNIKDIQGIIREIINP